MIPNLIYDVGMNNGDDTAYYLHRGFRVVAIEADPSLVSQAHKRFEREIAAGMLRILSVGIAQEAGELPFWICETASEWSSFDRRRASRDDSPHHQIQVPSRPFRSIVDEFGVPYYLKIDIEGHEHLCVEDLSREDLPKYISIEKTEKSVSLLPRFKELGYTGFKCISQYNFLPLELPPSKQQRYLEKMLALLESRNFAIRVFRRLGARRWMQHQLTRTRRFRGWSFHHGSSGPFGEDTLGSWQTLDKLVEVNNYFEGLFRERKNSVFWNRDIDYSFWADFHVKREV